MAVDSYGNIQLSKSIRKIQITFFNLHKEMVLFFIEKDFLRKSHTFVKSTAMHAIILIEFLNR